MAQNRLDMFAGAQAIGLEIVTGAKMKGMFIVPDRDLIAIPVFGIGHPVIAEHRFFAQVFDGK